MKNFVRIFAFLLAFALLGAPVGMARMMGGHEVATHQHSHGQSPQDRTQHVRFMVCAACVGVTAPSAALPERLSVSEAIAFANLAAPDSLNAIPLLPPPRS